jgi:hypothetical protein
MTYLVIGLVLGFAFGHRHAMKQRRVTFIRLIPFYPRHPSNN